jgi:hypothetical protein
MLRQIYKKFALPLLLIAAQLTTAQAQTTATKADGPTDEGYIVEDYAPFIFMSNDPSILCLCGDIDVSSSINFKRFIIDYGSPDLLFLNSTGGLVEMALAIALDVNTYEVVTAITEDDICYSSCAYIFFGGKDKILEGELGVHQISSSIDDNSITQFKLATVIEVLNRFNTPSFALVRMLNTPPDQIYVFTSEESWQISPKEWWEIFGSDGDTNEETTPELLEPIIGQQELEAIDFVKLANAAWSEATKYYSIDVVTNLYAETTKYYGEVVSQNFIHDDKSKFAARWPIRRYGIDENKTFVNCNDENFCSVSTIVNWSVQNPDEGRSASGESQWEYILRFQDGRFYIIEESAYVLTRS